eukprot:SAG11_NODE_76_length_18005_cov_6.523958_11_plen_114_part_00
MAEHAEVASERAAAQRGEAGRLARRKSKQEATKAIGMLIGHLFPLRAVLAGRRRVSTLVGRYDVLGYISLIFVRMGVMSVQQQVGKKMVQSLYLRDVRRFLRDMQLTALLCKR